MGNVIILWQIFFYGGIMGYNIATKIVNYMGIEDCVEITNGLVDLIVTTSLGPRILRYGFVGKENLLYSL